MTSEGGALKTSEFLRRRKLRLQQVREQSKDIAKLIRQRAEVEKLKRVVELDAKKEKKFLQRQEKVVKKLEQLYSKGLDNVGSSHTDASGLNHPGFLVNKDLSQLRGKEAAAELKRKKQEKLNEQKKLLDRKVQAREAANVISREKSTTIVNKLSTKSSTAKFSDDIKSGTKSSLVDKSDSVNLISNCEQNKDLNKVVSRNDMSTQWDAELLPNEWEPNIPALAIPKDDSIKEHPRNDTEKRKQPNLFALSDEMPSSLRGTQYNDKETSKPSVTLVSEYIQNRALRLREPDTHKCKKQSEDLKTLKQTIQRTRSSNPQAKPNDTEPLTTNIENSTENGQTKKRSVTMYNHYTKDTRALPFADEHIVLRDRTSDKDAYSEALNETTASSGKEKQNKKMQDMCNKIAMTRQHVEREYRDTMAFLNGLPKTKSVKPINKAYKDDQRLQTQSESRQRIMQQEFRKIEKESKQGMTCGAKPALPRKLSSANNGDRFNERDFQYSWMPVPEGDGNLAVHTIPTSVKKGKTGNSVKFSKVDSYHEYRSRHKHTPPTKDTCTHDKKINKRYVEAVIIQQKDDNSLSGSSITSNSGSIEDLRHEHKENKNTNDVDTIREMTDAERIIIYKILDYKNKKHDKCSKKSKSVEITQGSNDSKNEKTQTSHGDPANRAKQPEENIGFAGANTECAPTADGLHEGLYKINRAKGDNITSLYYADGAEGPDNAAEIDPSTKNPPCRDNIDDERQFAEGQYCSNKCESREHQPLRKHCSKRGDDVTFKNHTSNMHSSLITSTTSFKTATNVKLDGTHAESGFVKLIDEGGKEKGNIYIGATGLLRDDAYEVVIQLRKKGIKDPENREEVTKPPPLDVPAEINNLTSKESPNNIQIESKSIEDHTEAMDNPHTILSHPNNVITTNTTDVADLAHNGISMKHPKSSHNDLKSSDEIKHDKSNFKSFGDSNPVLNEVSKTTAIPTMAAKASAYTQTTHGPPTPKPAFVHMSSSTSTAYMSPPEVIFPKYFRRGYESSDEAYPRFDRLDDRHMMYDQQPYCEAYSKCRCRRCLVSTKAYLKKINSVEENRLKTPPNTARSNDTATEYDSLNINRMRKTSTHSSPVSTNRYHKCKIKGSKVCSKYPKNQSQLLRKKHKISVLYNRKCKVSSNTSKSTSKSSLKPLIKDYVNKLLSLNQEGIKAIQVMNQECSSVNTPPESVLNIPSNIHNDNHNNDASKRKISLEQIKIFIRKQIFEDCAFAHNFGKNARRLYFTSNLVPKRTKSIKEKSRKKRGHKVKILNISKKFRMNTHSNVGESSACVAKRNKTDKILKPVSSDISRSHSSSEQNENQGKVVSSETKNILGSQSKQFTNKVYAQQCRNQDLCDNTSCKRPKAVTLSGSTSPDNYIVTGLGKNRVSHPINSATQTSHSINNETSFMKLAEDKLQNMEKIANLTEKCTKRLSNLAKVLEEVRKNKSLAYSQISNSDSTDCDKKSEKPVGNKAEEQSSSNSVFDVKEKTDFTSPSTASSKEGNGLDSTDYEALLFDIPKDGYIELPHTDSDEVNDATPRTSPLVTTNIDHRNNSTKSRSKPPPALLRIHLKRTQENVVPHELSTVIEVDSPMSVKLKNQSSNIDNTNQSKNLVESRKEGKINTNDSRNEQLDSVLRQSTANNIDALRMISIDSPNDSKLRMMDLNQFNEIMLKPFISLRDYAQEYYADDVPANQETVSKGSVAIEDMSSLHSDGSLPDVVAELLKRKLITEPFQFDSASNLHSATVSSESTLSVLALSRARKGKQKIKENKENVTETSDTLSISSNPDLENAFKKLGMGWASSTLKKTKERLALSSSSNTSSSSLSQFKFKNASKQDMPTIVTDSVPSVPNMPLKTAPECYMDVSKNAEQQTSLTNSMTVKEFLTKELAKKITFTKSDRNETNEEFVSLLETKMPEELKNSCQTMIENNSADSVQSGNNNRARTSTPVQIFKSVAYHSSSSSNISNGLFSNADDLSSVKLTSTSVKYHSTSEKDELTVPNYTLKMRKGLSDCSKTDSY